MKYTVKILTFSLICLSTAILTSSCKPALKQCSNCSSIPAVEAPAYLKSHPTVVLLDVRMEDEVAAGKVEGSIHIDVNEPTFASDIAKLDKSKTYMVYCMSGIRSTTACNIMIEAGFDNLINVDGGYNEWPQ